MPDAADRARHLIELDRPAEALELLRTALAEDPADAQALALSAVAQLAMEQHAAALAAADALLGTRPDSEWGHRLRSLALGGLRRRHEAMTAAAEAVRLDPQGWSSHAQYALSAVHLPEHARAALDAARHATALAPWEPDAHFAVGYVAARLRMFEESDAAYRQVLTLDPTHTAARNNLAVAGGRSWGLGRRAQGFAQVLREAPTEQVARRNLEQVTVSLLVRVHLAALVALVVTTGVAAAGAAPAVRTVVALVGLAAVGIGAALLVRRLPPGALDLARAQLRRTPFLVALAAMFVAVATATAWVGLTPYHSWFPRAVLRPLGFLNVLLLVWSVMHRPVDE